MRDGFAFANDEGSRHRREQLLELSSLLAIQLQWEKVQLLPSDRHGQLWSTLAQMRWTGASCSVVRTVRPSARATKRVSQGSAQSSCRLMTIGFDDHGKNEHQDFPGQGTRMGQHLARLHVLCRPCPCADRANG